MPSFRGKNLEKVRELNGFSRSELGEKLSVSEQAIWQYENDQSIPKFRTFRDLENLFKVNTRYFFSNLNVEDVVSEENIAYRKDDRSSRKKSKVENQYLNFLYFFVSYFESQVVVPESQIKKLQKKVKSILISENVGNYTELSFKVISKVASYARHFLNIDDNKDLLYFLEKSGIYIFERTSLEEDIDAYSANVNISKDGMPFIILGTKRKSEVRRNFDLAHELGHLLLHRETELDKLESDGYKTIERQANQFASAFLLPQDEFEKMFNGVKYPSNPDYYIGMKKHFFVSIGALEMRAKQLNLISPSINNHFFANMNKKNYKTCEPLDKEIILKRPGKIKNLVKLNMENNLTDVETLESKFNVNVEFIARLFGFNEDFFEQFKKENHHQFYNKVRNIKE